MNFYTLVNIENDFELAQVIEFDDGQVVVKWSGSIRSLAIHKDLKEFESISLNEKRLLIKDGVMEEVY